MQARCVQGQGWKTTRRIFSGQRHDQRVKAEVVQTERTHHQRTSRLLDSGYDSGGFQKEREKGNLLIKKVNEKGLSGVNKFYNEFHEQDENKDMEK